MSAVILAFPQPSATVVSASRGADSLRRRAPPQAVEDIEKTTDFLASGHRLKPFTPAWCDQHLPLIDAAMDLLEADDVEFERRCQVMRDEDGRAILDELAGQLQRLGALIADVADALGLTAERIRDAMVPLA